jgi:hypothetical protein
MRCQGGGGGPNHTSKLVFLGSGVEVRGYMI